MGTLRTLKRRAFLAQVCLRACALLATAFCFLLFRQLSGITCLFKLLTGISCPTCGMSGAVLALCRGDLTGYIASNAFAVPGGYVYVFTGLIMNLNSGDRITGVARLVKVETEKHVDVIHGDVENEADTALAQAAELSGAGVNAEEPAAENEKKPAENSGEGEE